MELKSKLIALVERTCAEEQALLGRLSEEDRTTPGLPDRWSPKEEIAHVAGWTTKLVENLAAVAQGGTPTRYDDYEAINAREFEEYRVLAWPEVLEKAAAACQKLVEQVEVRSEAELKSTEILPWQGDRPLWQLIAGTGYIHPMTMHLVPIITRGDQTYATRLQEEGAQLLLGLDESQGWQGMTRYNLACHYALVGEAEKAIEELGKALGLNPGLTEWSKEDPDLASIRGDPACQVLYAE